MGFTVLFRKENQAGPVPASGTHAEVLAEFDIECACAYQAGRAGAVRSL